VLSPLFCASINSSDALGDAVSAGRQRHALANEPCRYRDGDQMNNKQDIIRAIVFPGVQNLPIYAAEVGGFFAKRGIHLELTCTQSSEQQRDGIADGTYDLAHSSIDNAIALVDLALQS
jgi:ABC-type nitrate/sulfonate/bicarbonate transport system substrate-binding protein